MQVAAQGEPVELGSSYLPSFGYRLFFIIPFPLIYTPIILHAVFRQENLRL